MVRSQGIAPPPPPPPPAPAAGQSHHHHYGAASPPPGLPCLSLDLIYALVVPAVWPAVINTIMRGRLVFSYLIPPRPPRPARPAPLRDQLRAEPPPQCAQHPRELHPGPPHPPSAPATQVSPAWSSGGHNGITTSQDSHQDDGEGH